MGFRVGLVALLLLFGCLPAAAGPFGGEEAAVVTIRDSGRAVVTLRVPLALHRPANAFRLYGARPLTLYDRSRRKELFREAFLELATRSELSPRSTVWDPLRKQWESLRLQTPGLQLLGNELSLSASPAAGVESLSRTARGVVRELAALPEYRHAAGLARALEQADLSFGAAEPVVAALELRALATDEAEQRLLEIGRRLQLEASGDPALREGYRAARADFEEVRKGLWPAVAASLRRQQGRLLFSAVRQIALSKLGWWAIFGSLGLMGAETALNSERSGQYAVALATLAAALAGSASDGGAVPHVTYAELLLNRQVADALKHGPFFGLKPAGGRSGPAWQAHCLARCDELRASLRADSRGAPAAAVQAAPSELPQPESSAEPGP